MLDNQQTFWTLIEWTTVICGILGTIWASSFKNYKIYIAFIIWIFGNLLGLFFHGVHSGQYGLLVICSIGLFITLIGLKNSLNKNEVKEDSQEKINKFQKLLLVVAGTSIALSFVTFGYFLVNDIGLDNWYQSKSFEILATLLNIAGISTISSNSKYSKYCWIFWMISNTLFIIITYHASLYGVMTQQIFFNILNAWGIIGWFFLADKKLKINTAPEQ